MIYAFIFFDFIKKKNEMHTNDRFAYENRINNKSGDAEVFNALLSILFCVFIFLINQCHN